MKFSQRYLLFSLIVQMITSVESSYLENKASNKTINCRETVVPSPIENFIFHFECWALAHNCYCFSPILELFEEVGQKAHSFKFQVNWFEANNICQSLNMSLVGIESRIESDLITDLILSQDVLSEFYWTKAIYSAETKNFTWLAATLSDNVASISKNASPFNYTNWAPGYPRKAIKANQAIVLNCQNDKKSCKWKDYNVNVSAGVMCEAPLNPTYIRHSNVTRKAKVKRYQIPGSAGHNQRKNAQLLKECPDVTYFPPHQFNLPPLECWALKANHHCYCFSPKILTSLDKNRPKELKVTRLEFLWLTALYVCDFLNMQMVAIESREENEHLSNHIANQRALQLSYWTSGFYSPGYAGEFLWTIVGNKNLSDLWGKPLRYTNWENGYPLDNESINNRMILKCQNFGSCEWRNQPDTEVSGILCEAELDPSYKIPNVTRQAEVKEFNAYSLDDGELLDDYDNPTFVSTTTPKPFSKSHNAKGNSNIPTSFFVLPTSIFSFLLK